MFNRKKIALLFLSVTTLNALIPIASVSADTSDNSEQVFTYDVKLADGEFVGEDGNIYNTGDLISAFENEEAIIIEIASMEETNSSGIQVANFAPGVLAPFIGSTIAIPGIGQVVVTAAGLAIGGVVVYKAGSWAWNKAKAYFSDESNWTADQIISKKRKGSIRREFPSEYLGKTLKQIDKEAKQGNAKAKKAKKILQDGRFKK
ncbi:hypothetical protein CAT7_11470 [Carnobacterium sp. AT7]|uniref:hypothetical protein n=1 Tax=Carnobacterium sp. AT7 TaxID=333990 RepID=UPI00015F2EA5|nr:hypothetical protein [Carnobacterium sp. AT7]EDP68197.1 hypothetical protein CAT7_11470 [Carnobacterium sp. AT7]